MDIKVTVSMDKKLSTAIDKLITAFENKEQCCKREDSYQADDAARELLQEMREKKKAPPKEEKKAPPKEEKKSNEVEYSIDDIRKALNEFTKGNADRRKQALAMLKEVVPSGKLTDIAADKYPEVLVKLAAL
jgi:hypothetical protein